MGNADKVIKVRNDWMGRHTFVYICIQQKQLPGQYFFVDTVNAIKGSPETATDSLWYILDKDGSK